jgi:hypothetical protein
MAMPVPSQGVALGLPSAPKLPGAETARRILPKAAATSPAPRASPGGSAQRFGAHPAAKKPDAGDDGRPKRPKARNAWAAAQGRARSKGHQAWLAAADRARARDSGELGGGGITGALKAVADSIPRRTSLTPPRRSPGAHRKGSVKTSGTGRASPPADRRGSTRRFSVLDMLPGRKKGGPAGVGLNLAACGPQPFATRRGSTGVHGAAAPGMEYGPTYLETTRQPENFDDPEPGAGLRALKAGMMMHLARHAIEQAMAEQGASTARPAAGRRNSVPYAPRMRARPTAGTHGTAARRASQRPQRFRLPSLTCASAPAGRAPTNADGPKTFASLADMARQTDSVGERMTQHASDRASDGNDEAAQKWRTALGRINDGKGDGGQWRFLAEHARRGEGVSATEGSGDRKASVANLPLMPNWKSFKLDQLMEHEARCSMAFAEERVRLKRRLDLRAMQQFGIDFVDVTRERHTLVSLFAPKNAYLQSKNDPMHLRDHQTCMILFNIISCNLAFTGMLAKSDAETESGSRRVVTSTLLTIAVAIGVLIFSVLCRVTFRAANLRSHLRTPNYVAWAFSLAVFYGTVWFTVAYVRCFSDDDTAMMLRQWTTSLGASWLVVEPLSAMAIVGFPSTMGRWFNHLEEMGFDPSLLF